MLNCPAPKTWALPTPGTRAISSLMRWFTKLLRYSSSQVPPGEENPMYMTTSVLCFFTVTPWRFTSSGRRASATATRFWVRTLAVSRLVPGSKVTVRFIEPSLALTLCM